GASERVRLGRRWIGCWEHLHGYPLRGQYRSASRLRDATRLRILKDRLATQLRILGSRRHAATGVGSLQARLRKPRDVVCFPDTALHRWTALWHRIGGVASSFQGRCVGRGGYYQRRQAASNGDVQLLNRNESMKRFQVCLALILLAATATSTAATIEMTVNGLVCAFCAQGIEKKL